MRVEGEDVGSSDSSSEEGSMWKLEISPEMDDVRGRLMGDDPGFSAGEGLASRELTTEVTLAGVVRGERVGEVIGVDLTRRVDFSGMIARPSLAVV
jgi:hypothetical protein